MITVANQTYTAARIKHAFDRKRIHIDELCDPERTLHIDSKVLATAEAAEEPIAEVATDGREAPGAKAAKGFDEEAAGRTSALTGRYGGPTRTRG